jgi:pantoate--beta-alanine ligase
MAFFGEKDWQQLAVIRRMARDLDLTRPHVDAIYAVPIVREADGLAMSSRNAYLLPVQRAAAAALPAAMRKAIAAISSGAPVSQALGNLHDSLVVGGFCSIDYAELRDGDSLVPVDQLARGARLFVAARIGGTRLIDNMAVMGEPND